MEDVKEGLQRHQFDNASMMRTHSSLDSNHLYTYKCTDEHILQQLIEITVLLPTFNFLFQGFLTKSFNTDVLHCHTTPSQFPY